MTTGLETRSITVTVGPVDIVASFDLTVAAGEWVSLIGPNGAGKSTVLKVIAGVAGSHQGSIYFGTMAASDLGRPARARLVARVAQRPVIPEGMTVFEYVLLGRTPHLGPLAAEGPLDLEMTAETLVALHLDGLKSRLLGTLSGGELQRAVLARALAQQAPILLLDEPTTGLDLGHQQEVLELVESLRQQRGLTVVSAIHDLTSAAQFSDRLILLSGGRKVMEGTPSQILTETNISLFFGATVTVTEGEDGRPVVVPTRSLRTAAAKAIS